MQITSSEYVGAGNRGNNNTVYKCRNLLNKDSVYSYYSNTPQGVETNLRDGLYALKDKYNLAKNCKACRELGISSLEMRWISAIQRYNTYGKVIFTIGIDTDFRNSLNKRHIPDRLARAFGNNNDVGALSKNAVVSVEEADKRWCIVDAPYTYILRRDGGIIYTYRTGIPTVYVKNVADKLRKLKSPMLFPKADRDICADLADKMDSVYNNSQSITLGCPAEIRAYDPEGRMSGSLINKQIIGRNLNNGFDPLGRYGAEEIPNSIYVGENKTIVLMFPSDKYSYEIIGTGEGVYNLNIVNMLNGEMATFNAVGIPITSKTVHKYTIDWNVLYNSGKGIELQMDSDGDGIFEKAITTDQKFIYSEIDPQL